MKTGKTEAHVGNESMPGSAAMEPDHEDREDPVRGPWASIRSRAAMEPDHEDREDHMR